MLRQILEEILITPNINVRLLFSITWQFYACQDKSKYEYTSNIVQVVLEAYCILI